MALEQSFGCALNERGGVPLLQWASWLRDNVPHGISTRLGGVSRPPYQWLNVGDTVGDAPGAVRANRLKLAAALGDMRRPIVFARQVHGSGVCVVSGAPLPGEEPVEADALVSDCEDVYLGVTVADCVPVLLYDPVRRVVAAVHAGWRGLDAGVLTAAVAKMTEAFGSEPRRVEAAIGPHIGVCCYEIGDELVGKFGSVVRAIRTDSSGRRFLSLARVAQHQLRDAGLEPANVNLSAPCTSCFVESYYSYRAEGGRTGRFAAVIGLEALADG